MQQQLSFEPGVGVIDESSFVKKGTASAGVSRQYCGRIGKVENCQVGVFLGYVSPQGHAFLDQRLYLPKGWIEDAERLQAAKVPETARQFKTKPQIAFDLLARSWAEGIPMLWVVADSTYGNSPELRQAIATSGRYYVMELGAQHHVIHQGRSCSLEALQASLPAKEWTELSRLGEQGPLTELWAKQRIRMPHDQVGEQWLLLRRPLHEPEEVTYLLSNASADSDLSDMVNVAWARHDIEQLLQEGKDPLGMADYEVRSWPGWHRHMALVMLAHTFLTLKRVQSRKKNAVANLVKLQPR